MHSVFCGAFVTTGAAFVFFLTTTRHFNVFVFAFLEAFAMYVTLQRITALPAFLAVIFPFLLTAATDFLDEVHFIDLIFFTFFFLSFNVFLAPAFNISLPEDNLTVAFLLDLAAALAVIPSKEEPVTTILSASVIPKTAFL